MKKTVCLVTFLCSTITFANLNTVDKPYGCFHQIGLSYSVLNWKKSADDFYKKLNTKLIDNYFENEEELFLWIEQNLKSTSFKSVDEAKEYWKLITDLQRNDFYKKSTTKISSVYSYLVHLEIENLKIERKLSDECTDNFMKHSEAQTEIYADQIEKLYAEYKGKEQDERFNIIYSTIKKNDFIRMNNCTSYFKSCLGI